MINTKILSCIAVILMLSASHHTWAQKKGKSISVTTDGVTYDNGDCEDDIFGTEFFVLDLGINSIDDKTDYSSVAALNYLQVPQEYQNENLYNLRSGKSWNVNLWPVLAKLRLVNTKGQKIFLGTGIGLQMYNFRYNKPLTHYNDVQPMVYMDTVNTITKNKLGFTYLSVPLMLTFKTRASDTWFVYGFGITGGYRLSSWTKQVSNERGKQKNHDQFDFSNFNSCVTAEIGLEGYFRLYATYQLTALQEHAIDQHPFSLGIRFGGI